MKQILIVLLFAAGVASVAGGEQRKDTVLNEQFLNKKGQAAWKTIVVLPFTGPPQHARVFAEYFSVQLFQQQRYTIISPSIAEIELTNKGLLLAKGVHTIQEAQHAGRLLGADAVIMGSIGTDYSIQPVHGEAFVKTKLIDTVTGEPVAEIFRTSPVLLVVDQHDHMTAVTKSAAEAMLSLLRQLSGETLSAPTVTGQGGGQGRTP